MEERLKVLCAEIDAQWREILNILSSIKEKSELLKGDIDNEDLTNSLAYKLHNLYSAYENMFKQIAKFFENQIEDFARYHTGLLKRMLIAIDDIRPHLLSEESFKILDQLRGFRHVFRHAYSYELDTERVLKLASMSIKLENFFSKDFMDFKDTLMKDK